MARFNCTSGIDTLREPPICAICGRPSFAVGVIVAKHPPTFAWGCESHVFLLEKVRTVTQATYDRWEQKAIELAGQDAGQYLDQIGKTDLATMTPEEWHEFCKTMCLSLGKRMTEVIVSGEAPF